MQGHKTQEATQPLSLQNTRQKQWLLRVVMLALAASILFPPVIASADRFVSRASYSSFSFLFSLSYRERIDTFLLLAAWTGILLLAVIWWEYLKVRGGDTSTHSRNPLKPPLVALMAMTFIGGGFGDLNASSREQQQHLSEIENSIDSLESEVQNCQQE